jgi:predicted dithiol-disulfide oxidoreductase (DUF899 family)
MTQQKIGTQEEWQAARDELLAEEKELTRRNDELARKRRELPWVPVEIDYTFETVDGTKSLAELFDGHSQLLVYHFMFGPDYAAGCPVCSSIADNLAPNAVHLAARDTKLMLVSRAPLEKLQGYRERMGWSVDWASTVGSEFNRELGFLHTEEELKPFLEGDIPPAVEQNADACEVDVATYVADGPGLSAYILSDGTVYRTYVTTTRGVEPAMGYYALLDRTPDRPQRGGRGGLLDTPPRRVRAHQLRRRTCPSTRPERGRSGRRLEMSSRRSRPSTRSSRRR